MLAVDWSGDAGLHNKRASRYFALALVSVDDEEVSRILTGLREAQGFPEHFEYHFAHGPCKTDGVRHGFMRAFTQSGLYAAVAVIDKDALIKLGVKQSGVEFVVYHLWNLIQSLPPARVDKQVLLVDGQKADVKPVCSLLKTYLQRGRSDPEIRCRPKSMRSADSRRCEAIMVADMLAGAARHVAAGKTPDYLAPLAKKIILTQLP